MPEKSITIEVGPVANATVALLQKQALRDLANILDVESPEEAVKQITELDFDVYTDGHVRFAEGDIIGTYPIYKATMNVKLRNEDRGSYSGRLF